MAGRGGDIAEGEELTYDRGMRSEEWMKRAGKSIVVKAGESSAGVEDTEGRRENYKYCQMLDVGIFICFI